MAEYTNVVICICDQLRAFETGCYGNEVVQTPNIDRLASGGVRFETACSNNPVCTPARSIVFSGQYSRSCQGCLTNADEPNAFRSRFPAPTLAERFRDAGYTTGLVGKWHIHDAPECLGFDHAIYPLVRHRYTGQTYIDSRGGSAVVDGFAAEFEMEQLGKWLGEHRQEPFFLCYSISQPHMPVIDAPERYTRMYPRKSVPLRENVFENGEMSWDEEWFKIYLWDFLYYQEHLPYTDKLPDGFDLRELTALYDGLATWADDQLGHLMRLLEANSLLENTLVVFTSDHGDNLGSHGLFNKSSLYEEAIRIPMIFHQPGSLAPRVVTSQVSSLVDIMPTALSLAGLSTPESAHGTDLSGVVRGDVECAGENIAFIEDTRLEIGVRTPSHLYGIKMQGDPGKGKVTVENEDHMFFDVDSDPFEHRNLIGTQEDPALASDLRKRLLRWDNETPWLDIEP